jgi:hypothetical protein
MKLQFTIICLLWLSAQVASATCTTTFSATFGGVTRTSTYSSGDAQFTSSLAACEELAQDASGWAAEQALNAVYGAAYFSGTSIITGTGTLNFDGVTYNATNRNSCDYEWGCIPSNIVNLVLPYCGVTYAASTAYYLLTIANQTTAAQDALNLEALGVSESNCRLAPSTLPLCGTLYSASAAYYERTNAATARTNTANLIAYGASIPNCR